MVKNSHDSYGYVSKSLHWLMALMVVALFSVGAYMVTLDYYSPWYKTLPFYHKSTGVVVAALLLLRVLWRLANLQPQPLPTHTRWEKALARVAHALIYVLLCGIVVSGYLISTADGRAISVFDWFSIPSAGELFLDQARIAGAIHEYLAYGLMTLVGVHALGALKHHFIDKDKTLKRML
ncbi:MAG: cytochrome b [Gammaproteobacteria bacterium]|nr:cytochrome b [Gammaproteobacteria bacterium]